jgi:hypothetical protein
MQFLVDKMDAGWAAISIIFGLPLLCIIIAYLLTRKDDKWPICKGCGKRHPPQNTTKAVNQYSDHPICPKCGKRHPSIIPMKRAEPVQDVSAADIAKSLSKDEEAE